MSKTQRISLTVIGLLLIISLVMGISYAAWRLTLSQTTANILNTSCFDITFEEENAILLQNTFPMHDEDGKKLIPYSFTIKNNCESYATYQVQLEIINTSTLRDEYLKIMINDKNPGILNTLQLGEKTLNEADRAYIIDNNALDVNEEKTYTLRVWLDENVTTETEGVQGSSWSAKITINAKHSDRLPTDYEKCVANYGENSINCQIIAQVDTSGKCALIESDGTVNLNKDYEKNGFTEENKDEIIADVIEDDDGYICSAPDDYGTSYYYRGAVENNWVKFADSYWRIVRLNGDGSIRLLYNGEASVIDVLEPEVKAQVLSNGYNDKTTKYTLVGESQYNLAYDDIAFVGYMYNDVYELKEMTSEKYTLELEAFERLFYASEVEWVKETDEYVLIDPISVAASDLNSDMIGKYIVVSDMEPISYELVEKVVNVTQDGDLIQVEVVPVSSVIANFQENKVDSEIKKNIDGWYEKKFKDTSYENFLSDTLFCNDRSMIDGESFPQISSDRLPNIFRGYGDPLSFMWEDDTTYVTLNPTLKCEQQIDRFTVDDTIIGNGALTYPIAILTNDEKILAGGSNFAENSKYYLYNGTRYWFLTPSNFFNSVANVNTMDSAYSGHATVTESFFARPVINLKPNSLKFGDGTALNPYRVS